MKSNTLLWLTILVPPIVWFLSLCASFAIAPVACYSAGKTALHVTALVCALVAAACGMTAAAKLRHPDPQVAENAERAHAMNVAGVVSGAAFVLVILAQWLPDVLLTGCE